MSNHRNAHEDIRARRGAAIKEPVSYEFDYETVTQAGIDGLSREDLLGLFAKDELVIVRCLERDDGHLVPYYEPALVPLHVSSATGKITYRDDYESVSQQEADALTRDDLWAIIHNDHRMIVRCLCCGELVVTAVQPAPEQPDEARWRPDEADEA